MAIEWKKILTEADMIDEDNMASDSDTKVPTQQSVKKYVDDNAGGGGTDNVVRDNMMILNMRLGIAQSLAVFKIEDGVIDVFTDETGIDSGSCVNEEYNSSGDYYTTSMGGEVDNMEYASDALAQAAYPTNGTTYGMSIASRAGGLSAGYTAIIISGTGATIGGAGTIRSFSYYTTSSANIKLKVLRVNGSNYDLVGSSESFATTTGGSTRTLTSPITGVQSGDLIGIYTANVLNNVYGTDAGFATKYLTSEVTGTTAISSWGDVDPGAMSIAVVVDHIDVYSESTIKTQGSYSLKGVALATDSLNKTLTKTFGTPLDLSGVNSKTFQIRSNRTGSNIKVGLHDSGGTTTEVTPNITSADTFQEVTVDLSGVADANKDAIDSIIITIVNADSANTFYIDGFNGGFGDMTLVSESVEAEAEPSNVRFLSLIEPVDAITVNTDLKAYASMDDGSNWEQITLVDEGDYDSSKHIYAGSEDLTSQSDQTMVWKITTHNNKEVKIHAVGLLWK